MKTSRKKRKIGGRASKPKVILSGEPTVIVVAGLPSVPPPKVVFAPDYYSLEEEDRKLVYGDKPGKKSG